MPLFDMAKKAKEALLGKKMSEKPVMKVTMLGARGVGKTSVLTSMYNNMNTAVNDTRLHIVGDTGTNEKLAKKTTELKNMFFSNNDICDAVQSGIAGDSKTSKFFFDFGLNVENINMAMEIQDYPGEYVKNQPDVVKKYISESQAVIIAIDTPHLMECDGRYNEGKNFPSLITSFFKETLEDSEDEKLIMLVPLKCEKYYHEHRIEEVTQEVRKTYRDLIRYLKSKDRYACVIAPIQTLGQIVFDGFQETDGQVDEIIIDGNPVPEKVNYRYLRPGAVYSPVHCEQPLYYLLSFIGKQYLRMKSRQENTGFLNKLLRKFDMMPNVQELLTEIQLFSYKMADASDGFVTVFGAGKVVQSL